MAPRKLNLINFCFTLLNEGDIAKSPWENHTIAIINSTEKYEDLKIALSDIRSEVQSLTSIKCDSMDFPIEYFLWSNLKFLAIICGIDSATSTSKRHDMDAEWSFKGNSARTISDIQACCKQPKAKRFNCTNMPLFPTVPIDHTVVDMLHLFLRVTGVLFNLSALDIRRMDAIVKCISESNLNSSENLHKLERFLHKDCHIPFKFRYCREAKDLKWRDLMGPEKLVVFNKIDLPNLFSESPNVHAIQLLWKQFKSLYDKLHSGTISFRSAVQFEEDAKQWVKDFTKIYQTKHVMPYLGNACARISKILREFSHFYQ